MIIEDDQLDAATLGPVLEELLADDERRETMAHNARLVDHGAAADDRRPLGDRPGGPLHRTS